MKFKYVDPKTVEWLVPRLYIDPLKVSKTLERMFTARPAFAAIDPMKGQWYDFNIEIRICTTADIQRLTGRVGMPAMFVCQPVPATNYENSHDPLNIGRILISRGNDLNISFPIYSILKSWGEPGPGAYTLYVHSIVGADRMYTGITKRPWYKRYDEHCSRANSGSNLLFHRALRLHGASSLVTHTILGCGMTYEAAMHMEEKWVESMSLHPRGLNMIPGGFAGIKYLSKLGYTARNELERDEVLTQVIERESIAGKPNPLCASRWASDQDYVNSVICGHSNRLTVDQVRNIKMLSAAGCAATRVADVVSTSISRVAKVLSGKTYRRVA